MTLVQKSRQATTLRSFGESAVVSSNRTFASVTVTFPWMLATPTTSVAKTSLSFDGSSSGGFGGGSDDFGGAAITISLSNECHPPFSHRFGLSDFSDPIGTTILEKEQVR
jgi:hypothetical protein